MAVEVGSLSHDTDISDLAGQSLKTVLRMADIISVGELILPCQGVLVAACGYRRRDVLVMSPSGGMVHTALSVV